MAWRLALIRRRPLEGSSWHPTSRPAIWPGEAARPESATPHHPARRLPRRPAGQSVSRLSQHGELSQAYCPADRCRRGIDPHHPPRAANATTTSSAPNRARRSRRSTTTGVTEGPRHRARSLRPLPSRSEPTSPPHLPDSRPSSAGPGHHPAPCRSGSGRLGAPGRARPRGQPWGGGVPCGSERPPRPLGTGVVPSRSWREAVLGWTPWVPAHSSRFAVAGDGSRNDQLLQSP